MKNVKEINIKNRTYYFFNDMRYKKDFYSNLIKVDKKSYKIIDKNVLKRTAFLNLYSPLKAILKRLGKLLKIQLAKGNITIRKLLLII